MSFERASVHEGKKSNNVERRRGNNKGGQVYRRGDAASNDEEGV